MTEQLAPCFWDGPRPCTHDAGAPLPKAGPLRSWKAARPLPDGFTWDGRPIDDDNAGLIASRRARGRPKGAR